VLQFCQGGLLQLCLQHFVDSYEVIIIGYVVHDFDNCNDTHMDISSIGDISLTKPAMDPEATMYSANIQKTWSTCSHTCDRAVA